MTPTQEFTMPAPDGVQQAHVEAMHTALRRYITEHGGWIGFDEYLEQVLYAPGLGYYSAGATKLGAVGDFTTAPEISPLFGACIARQCAPFLQSDGELLELGAGSGALAEVMLQRLASLDALPARYLILEVSADLKDRQRTLLSRLPVELYERVQWLDALPKALRGVIVANEVADALPFQCFAATSAGYAERGVALGGAGQPEWAERAASVSLLAELKRLEASLGRPFEAGYRGELCLRAGPWMAALAGALESGGILLFDYGFGRSEYYHPQRRRGTLRCHYRHRAHEDPFLYPGLQDISAWVDFTRIAESASDAGLEIAGYCTQAAFLLGAGIDAELAIERTPLAQARAASGAQTLLMPGEMGESFKAMLLTRGPMPEMPAFALQDMRRLL
jgi:SAM-dependent MidA family methyltransferase